MTTNTKDPIQHKWTSSESPYEATAAQVAAKLATYAVTDFPEHLTPYLAAAGAEIAVAADTRWRFSADDLVVALLRNISRGALIQPAVTGPHTQRLFEQLEHLGNADNPPKNARSSDPQQLPHLDPAKQQLLENWHGFVFDD